jgi:polygalacturonase
MDCKVYAEGAYAGFNNCPGQGGGTYHIEVEGGKYGLVADNNYRFPMIAGSSFTGQTDASIKYTGTQVPMVLAGCRLESKGNSAVDLTTSGSHAGLSMIDCMVKVGTSGVVARADSKQNVFLENVSVTGATSIQVAETTIADPTIWTNIKRYSCCEARAQNLVNGEVTTETFVKMEKMGKAPDHSVNYDKHWSRIPSFEDTDAANVKDFGALGNGTGDDSAAFKKAMAASDKVFVPKGTYKLSEPLVLGAKTKLFSIRSASIDAPSITTVDDPNATTEVYFISTRSTFEWKAGKGVCGFARGAKISGNGGGRFFGAGGFSKLEGTNQPIKIYSLNVERRSTNPQSSIVNCSNVSVFYFKSEATVKGFGVGVAENTGNTPMGIVNSKNIRVYGVCGNIETAEQRPVMQITNCENVLISQIKSFQTGDFPQVNETRGDQNYAIPSNKAVALFIRE